MNIKEIPWFNRPWTKIKREGISTLDDAELISVIFGRGNAEYNAIDLSNKLLSKYNLTQFSTCIPQELCSLLGDEIKAYQIMCLGELFRRAMKLKRGGYTRAIQDPEDACNILKEQLCDKTQEHLFAFYLDSNNTILDKPELISLGLIDETLAHPREVFRTAIFRNAKKVLLAHNHPSGDCIPSQEDRIISEKMFKSGDIIGINVVDHIIIGSESYYSIRADKSYTLKSSFA